MSLQDLRTDDIDVLVVSEQEWHRALLLAHRTQKVRLGEVRVLVVYPTGSTVEEIKSLMILIGGVGMLMFLAPAMARDISLIGRRFVESSYSIPMDFEHLRLVFSNVAMEVGVVLAPAMAMFVVLAIVANVALAAGSVTLLTGIVAV